MDWLEIINKGGPVVLILIGYSLVALTIVIERLLYFWRLARPTGEFAVQVQSALSRGQKVQFDDQTVGPETAVVRGMMAAANAGVKDLGQVASRLGSNELQRMERGFRTLGVLGNTAPLLGLFGTITGMIKAFRVIEQAGGKVDAQALAGGIWEAMITTGVGLAVAIPVLLLLHMLEGLSDQRTRAMRHYASLVLEQRQACRPTEEEEAGATRQTEVLTNAF